MITRITSHDILCREAFLICLDASVDEDTFLRRGKVRSGTYAGELLSKLHDAIFRQSLQLDRDYREYYSIEYPTFAEYMHKRFLLRGKPIEDVSAEFGLGKRIIYFCPRYCFISEDYGVEFLSKLLEPGGPK